MASPRHNGYLGTKNATKWLGGKQQTNFRIQRSKLKRGSRAVKSG